MRGSFVTSLPLPEFSLWEKMKDKRNPISFDLELTARCNNNCRHCCINLPANDKKAQEEELPIHELQRVIDQAVDLGAFWCLITGGEPLLREDFFDIYLYMRKKGLLVSVFTNAILISKEHVKFFKEYPPRNIEVTVYGVTGKTYERVTKKPGSFDAFMRGVDALLQGGIKVRLKAMALRSNVHELSHIAQFCRERTKDYFRFDPFLHLRFDGNESRNEEIKSERLSAEEIVAIEQADFERAQALTNGCDRLINPEFAHYVGNHLFHCGTGIGNFAISYNGFFRLCSSLWHRDCVYDLKKGSLREAWQDFIPKVRDTRSNRKEFLEKCRVCPIINLCIWCPGHAHLETGELDNPVEYFCAVAHTRAEWLKKIFGRTEAPVPSKRNQLKTSLNQRCKKGIIQR